jgi:signal transduction histidine kinase
MRRRLVLAIVAVATAAVVLFAVPLGLVMRSSYRDHDLARLQRDTLAATRELDLGRSSSDSVELSSGSDVIGVYARGGRRVAGRGPRVPDGLVRAVLASGRAAERSGARELLVAVPLLSNESVTGVVRAARSDDAVDERVHRAWFALGALASALIGAAGLAASVLGRRLARPLERLAVTARRLGDGDFAVRFTASGVPEVDAVGAALDTTAQRLDDLVSRERAFSADASHQLRTPLAALRLELEAIELDGPSTPELTAALGQVDRLQATVDTLLKAARDAPQRAGHTDLEALLDDARQRWHSTLAARGRPLRTLVRASSPVAAAAPGVVSEVVDVLISNAHEHGAGTITVTVRDTAGWLAVDVGDEGPGFTGEPEDVFMRRSEAAEGHGIGLALARSLAHAEGGRLTVTNARPGPVFTLLIAKCADHGDAC